MEDNKKKGTNPWGKDAADGLYDDSSLSTTVIAVEI